VRRTLTRLLTALLLAGAPPALVAGLSLSPQEAAGKRIYTRGESPSGGGISATVGGDVVLPATQAPCASCHGGDGLGRQEGGADPGRIIWSHLTKSYGHVHPDGRRHPPFTATTVGRAIRQGVDPAGNRLAPAMPRFSMSSEDLAALVAYLKRLEEDVDPGIRERTVRIGTLLPERGRLAPIGRAIQTVLERSLRRLDATGGVHGRRIELAVIGYGDEPGGAAAALERAAAKGLFALVAPFAPGREEEIQSVARRRGIPVIGPITPLTRVADPPDPGLFYVAGGLAEEARALVQWAGEALPRTRGRFALVAPTDGPLAWVAEEARRGLASGTLGKPLVVGLPLSPAALVERLRAARIEAVLFLGAGDDLAAFGKACVARRFAPRLLATATLCSRTAPALPPRFAGKVHVAFASIPSDVTSSGARHLAEAGGELSAGSAARPAQVAALQSADVLLEGLRRAGRQLSRERLIEGLEGIYRLQTGLGPPVTFGPARRAGASGAWVMEPDLAAGSYGRAVWVRLD